MVRPLLILGNAKSLAKSPFYNYKVHSMGMNIAYRFWHQIGWYPTYYVSLDRNINLKYARELYFLVMNRFKYGIRGFLFRKDLAKFYPKLLRIKEVHFVEDLNKAGRRGFTGDPHMTSGSYSIRWGINMGYNKVYLLGIDCNYVEIKNQNSIITPSNRLKITIRNNPNYFFDGYQRQGDPLHISRRKGSARNKGHEQTFKQIAAEFNHGKKPLVVISSPVSLLKRDKVLPYEPVPSAYLKKPNENPISFNWNEVIQRIINRAPPIIEPEIKVVAAPTVAKTKPKVVKTKPKVTKTKPKVVKTKAKPKTKKAKITNKSKKSKKIKQANRKKPKPKNNLPKVKTKKKSKKPSSRNFRIFRKDKGKKIAI